MKWKTNKVIIQSIAVNKILEGIINKKKTFQQKNNNEYNDERNIFPFRFIQIQTQPLLVNSVRLILVAVDSIFLCSSCRCLNLF